MDTLELWPDHGDGPLWNRGRAVPLESLGLPAPLAERASKFQRTYSEDFVDDPTEATAQAYWGEGRSVLEGLRNALAGQYEVIVTEPWYGAETRTAED